MATIDVNVGGIENAIFLAEEWGWRGEWEGCLAVGFDAAVHLTVAGDEVVMETISPDEELCPEVWAQLFGIEWGLPRQALSPLSLQNEVSDKETAETPSSGGDALGRPSHMDGTTTVTPLPTTQGVAVEPAPQDERKRPDAKAAIEQIRTRILEGHAPNLLRQWGWLGVGEKEILALQTLGEPNYFALARGIEEAVFLTSPDGLKTINKWGKVEAIKDFQGVYLIPNRLVGRIEEAFTPGRWGVMPKGLITDARITQRRAFYLDLDTQRRDEGGKPVDLPISATKEELRLTIERSLLIRQEILDVFVSVGIERAEDAIADMMSGNGIQFWFALNNIPETEAVKERVHELLAIWSVLYDTPVSHVDVSVYDAKRIAPVAGTPKRKGVDKKLHRRITFAGAPEPQRLSLPELDRVVVAYRQRLTPSQRVTVGKHLNLRPPPIPQKDLSPKSGLSACNQHPIREVAAKLGLNPDRPLCPWCGKGGGTDVAFLDERNLLNCKHASCSVRPNRTPVDLVAKVVFGVDDIKGTKGISTRVVGWFKEHLGSEMQP